MKVVLLQDVPGVGKKFEVKELSSGYAKNFLFPKKLAEPADASALAKVQAHEQEAALLLATLKKQAQELAGTVLEFKVNAGKQGVVFGSVTKSDIEKNLIARGVKVQVVKLEKPLKLLGTFPVRVSFGKGIETEIKVTLRAQP